MARVVVYDNQGNKRMERNTSDPSTLKPHPNFTEQEWCAMIVEATLKVLEQEEKNLLTSRAKAATL